MNSQKLAVGDRVRFRNSFTRTGIIAESLRVYGRREMFWAYRLEDGTALVEEALLEAVPLSLYVVTREVTVKATSAEAAQRDNSAYGTVISVRVVG